MSRHGGLAVFKQDHVGGELVQLEASQRNVSTMEAWLGPQGQAASKHGVTRMLCGSISSMWMHSISTPSATRTRAGNDYLPGFTRKPGFCSRPKDNRFAGRVSNAVIGFSNLINWAVGLRPYKDSWFSTHQDWEAANVTCLESHGTPPYFGLQEQYPELQLLVSAMSAGPIAPGDNIGFSNVSLIMRACRADGVLLHPDRPAVPPDRMFLSERGKGEVQWTVTRLDGMVW